ncbi:MAG: TrkA family potassium uptake protein [Clostridia bacterium]|nr:TrkA family potassium uptake protein [Clostridia bacterium]
MKTNSNKKQTQFAVLGLGRFGFEIAKALFLSGCEVLAVDIDEERTAEIVEFATHTAVADVTEETVLRQLAISSFDTVIIAIGDDLQASIICSFICKELGCAHIVAKARDSKHARILEKVGVDDVIIPEADSAQKAASKLTNPQLNDLMEFADGYSIAEFGIPKQWIDKTLAALKIPAKFHVNILIIVGEDNAVSMPTGDAKLKPTDKIVIGGLNDDVKRLADAINRLS